MSFVTYLRSNDQKRELMATLSRDGGEDAVWVLIPWAVASDTTQIGSTRMGGKTTIASFPLIVGVNRDGHNVRLKMRDAFQEYLSSLPSGCEDKEFEVTPGGRVTLDGVDASGTHKVWKAWVVKTVNVGMITINVPKQFLAQTSLERLCGDASTHAMTFTTNFSLKLLRPGMR